MVEMNPEIYVPIIVYVLVIPALVYATNWWDRLVKDRMYEGSAEEVYRKAMQQAYDAAKNELEYVFSMELRKIKKQHFPALVEKFKDSAELVYEKDVGMDLETKETLSKRKVFRVEPTSIRLTIQPTQEFVGFFEHCHDVKNIGKWVREHK